MPARGDGEDGLGCVPKASVSGERPGNRQVVRGGHNRARRKRRNGAGQQLRKKIEHEGVAPEPCPADLSVPDFGSGAPPERLPDRPVDDTHPQSEAAHKLGRGGIFRQFGCERPDAAGTLYQFLAVHHGLALGKTEPDGIGEQLPARLVRIEEGAFEFAPDAVGAATDSRGRHQPGISLPLSEQATR